MLTTQPKKEFYMQCVSLFGCVVRNCSACFFLFAARRALSATVLFSYSSVQQSLNLCKAVTVLLYGKLVMIFGEPSFRSPPECTCCRHLRPQQCHYNVFLCVRKNVFLCSYAVLCQYFIENIICYLINIFKMMQFKCYSFVNTTL